MKSIWARENWVWFLFPLFFYPTGTGELAYQPAIKDFTTWNISIRRSTNSRRFVFTTRFSKEEIKVKVNRRPRRTPSEYWGYLPISLLLPQDNSILQTVDILIKAQSLIHVFLQLHKYTVTGEPYAQENNRLFKCGYLDSYPPPPSSPRPPKKGKEGRVVVHESSVTYNQFPFCLKVFLPWPFDFFLRGRAWESVYVCFLFSFFWGVVGGRGWHCSSWEQKKLR